MCASCITATAAAAAAAAILQKSKKNKLLAALNITFEETRVVHERNYMAA